MASQFADVEELAIREGDGISVSLLWQRGTDHVRVSVLERHSGNTFELEVAANENPMDVFRHPYAYASAPASRIHPRSWSKPAP